MSGLGVACGPSFPGLKPDGAIATEKATEPLPFDSSERATVVAREGKARKVERGTKSFKRARRGHS